MKVKHGSRAITSIAITLCAHVCIYKTERCSDTMFRKKILYTICSVLLSYIIRGRWCNIIVVNVHAPCEDTSNYIKDSFYEELGCVFDQFPRYDTVG
jgi:hypothetical protein